MYSVSSPAPPERRFGRRLVRWLAIAASTAGIAADLAPDELVRKVTAEVMDAVGRDSASRPIDRAAAIAIAEEKILPQVDFGEATRLRWGARGASPRRRSRRRW